MIWDDRPPTWQPTPEEYYAACHRIGSTALKLWIKSPKAFGQRIYEMATDMAYGRVVTAEKPSAAMILGSVVDCMLTEPDRFHERFVVTDDERISHVGIHKISHKVDQQAKRMVAALRRDPDVRKLVLDRPCLRQMCHAWRVGGVLYRLRADFVTQINDGRIVLIDLKCWGLDDLVDWRVKLHAKRLGTFVQMALEAQGLEDLWDVFPSIVLIIVSSREPHDVVVRELIEKDLDAARFEVSGAQKGIAEALRTGDFGGRIDEGIRPFRAA